MDKEKQEIPARIAVLDRGFVMVGRFELHPKLAFHWTGGARVIRRYGTSKGIAELAGGPLTGTVLDTLATVTIPFRALLFFIEVEEKAWKKHI